MVGLAVVEEEDLEAMAEVMVVEVEVVKVLLVEWEE